MENDNLLGIAVFNSQLGHRLSRRDLMCLLSVQGAAILVRAGLCSEYEGEKALFSLHRNEIKATSGS